MSDDSTVLELKHVHLRRGRTTILDDLSWRVLRGQHWGVVGPNGSGKTTMLKVATGAMWPTRGEVWALGHRYGHVNLLELRKRIGWVSSALGELIPPRERALEVVLSGLFASYGVWEKASEVDLDRAGELLEFLGCSHLAERPYGVLSQGEKQRVLVARALMTRSEILIMDEPASGLDITSRELLLEAVEKLARRSDAATIIFVTHHIEELVPSISHVVVIESGRVLAAGRKENILTAETLSNAFDIPLAVDIHNGRYWPRVNRLR